MFDNKDDQQPTDQFGSASSSPLMPDTPVSSSADSTFSAPTIVAPSDGTSMPSPATTTSPDSDGPSVDSSAPLPSVGSVSSPATSSSSSASEPDDLLTTSGSDALLKLKQDALQQLSPLVGHLDQTPEEKFRTTMMMIQATDDKSLLNQAYESAQKISDEKVRAQALLDVVNEINYFTQHHEA